MCSKTVGWVLKLLSLFVGTQYQDSRIVVGRRFHHQFKHFSPQGKWLQSILLFRKHRDCILPHRSKRQFLEFPPIHFVFFSPPSTQLSHSIWSEINVMPCQLICCQFFNRVELKEEVKILSTPYVFQVKRYRVLYLHKRSRKYFLRVASQAFLCVSEIDQKSVIKAMTNL